MARHPLAGSDRSPIHGATSIGKADPAEPLRVSVILRSRDAAAFHDHIGRIASGARATRDEFAERYGATQEDIEAVRSFAAAHGLEVVEEHAARRTVVLAGAVAQFNEAFGVDLQQFTWSGGRYRGRVGPIQLDDALAGIVEAVLGLDDRPAARPHFRYRRPAGKGGRHPAANAARSYTPLEIAAAYGFPAGTGAGECIAIIELGGGYRPADLATYFTGLGLAMPKVTAVPVDQGSNSPTGAGDGPDGEVMLDIEVAGAIAPEAAIAVYFAPNTDAGFLDAVTTAIHDTVNRPSVVSISWGGPESSWSDQAKTAFDQALQAAASIGVTVCVASGDNGSSDGLTDGANHVDFPASSPYALACGGTNLQISGTGIAAETVWHDGSGGGAGGGGVSTFFALPSWQSGLNVTATDGGATPLAMRGVPDVAGDADPETGYEVRVDGTDTVIGGTSAVAPLWAGLIARLNAAAGTPLGYLNPSLYKAGSASGAVRDITQGNNGAFGAAPGWDACTGLGSPGPDLGAALVKPPAA